MSLLLFLLLMQMQFVTVSLRFIVLTPDMLLLLNIINKVSHMCFYVKILN